MKKANHNEMDLVLRSLAKSGRDDSSLGNGSLLGEKGDIGAHLDADELNSFAEGLVPEPARVRYTEHLADCVSCRRILVGLTQAVGGMSQTPVANKESGPGFWQGILAIFSPSVLRYAVPALALTGVIAISLFGLRQVRRQDLVAHNQSEAAGTPGSPQVPEKLLTSSGKETSVVTQASPVVSTTSTSAPKETSGSQVDQGVLAGQPGKPDLAAAAPTLNDAAPPPPVVPASESARSQPTFASEPKVGAVSSGRPVLSEADKNAELKKEDQPADRKAQKRERDEQEVVASKDAEEDRSAFKTNANAPSGPRRSDGRMNERPASGVKNKKGSDEDETRSVSGRSFRRQGNAWIDTGYESSRATINVGRGTEQFRALAADEPGIRTIADQLAGEVIVVWKGKAYRIR